MVLDYTDLSLKKNIFFSVESQASWGSFFPKSGRKDTDD